MEYLKNPIVIGILFALIWLIAYVINNKLTGEEVKNPTLMKVGLLGFMTGTGSVLLYKLVEGSKISFEQEILTGNPDF